MLTNKLPKEYFFKEGCYIQEWHNGVEDEDMSVARVRVEGFTETRLHALHGTTERYVILSGRGEVSVDQKSALVAEGDVIVIPASVPQKIKNIDAQDLIFLAVCQPRFQEYNYEDLDAGDD